MAVDVPLSVKYRPKNLSEVIGQPVVVQAFTNAFKNKTLHHAYILAGNFGSGKTTVARIVAAMENCEKGPTMDPCGECSNCIEIFSGKSFDVKEMDAASNRGVDDIRKIHQELYHSPINCRTKYILLDEAHSLTGIAAEAALKMIEEPPSFVRFMLATTDAHLLKETIHSRCITWKFNKVGWMEIYNHLIMVAKKEELDYEDDALKMAAQAAFGSVRDSLQNLQTMMNYVGDDKITKEVAKEALGVIDRKVYFDFVETIFDADLAKGYEIINNMLKDGKEAGVVLKGLHRHFNNLLTATVCQTKVVDLSLSEEEVKRYNFQASKIKPVKILKMLSLIKNIAQGLKYNLDQEFLFNTFYIECVLESTKR